MKRILIPLLIAVAVTGVGLYAYSATAQTKSLSDIAISIAPIYPQATVVNDRITSVDGYVLNTMAVSDQSETIDRSGSVPKSKFEKGRATLELGHGLKTNGDHIVSATITNNSEEPIYLTKLIIVGETAQKIAPLTAFVAHHNYSPELFGNKPKPAVTEPIMIAPGQSFSGYISGNWSVENMTVESFSAGAVYQYNANNTEFIPDNNWSISVESTKIL